MTNEQMSEHSAWRGLVAVLNDAGAVTPEDCRASTLDDSTPGRRVFQAIRVWADDQVIERCKAGRDGCRKPPTRMDLKNANFVRLFTAPLPEPKPGELWDLGVAEEAVYKITSVTPDRVTFRGIGKNDDGENHSYGRNEFRQEHHPMASHRSFRRVAPAPD